MLLSNLQFNLMKIWLKTRTAIHAEQFLLSFFISVNSFEALPRRRIQ